MSQIMHHKHFINKKQFYINAQRVAKQFFKLLKTKVIKVNCIFNFKKERLIDINKRDLLRQLG